MSGKLDQSLDEIVKDRRTTSRGRGRGGRRAPNTARTTATTAPAGGVGKNKGPKGAPNRPAAHPPVPITGAGDSKVLVSGLPTDINEAQIKDYFSTTIGPCKRVHLTYGPNGQSRGIATIIFNKPGSALEAATKLNGVRVDNRPMRIEVIVAANQAPTQIPAKALGDRIATNKAMTKATPKTATPRTSGTTAGTARGGRKGRGRGNTGRKPKTAEELDAEMVDYFEPGAAAPASGEATANGTTSTAVAAGGDAGMEDEIM